jgi:rubrerythrin
LAFTLNAFELFDIAEQIEQNGAEFYRKAAEFFDEAEISELFLRLADWEMKHKKTFALMREQLAESNQETAECRTDESPPEKKFMAGLAVFGIRPNPVKELDSGKNKADIIIKAVENEKDSIVFYSGLKDFADSGIVKDKIDVVINEELRHIRILNEVRERRNFVQS